MDCREYGDPPYRVIVLHGGPGAPGCCAGICRGLAEDFGVLEHLQGKRSIRELVEELRGVITGYGIDKAVLIGHSFGAWLAFIFAATYPQYVGKLILAGCGPFEPKYYPLLVEARSVKTMPLEQIADMKAAGLYSGNMQYDPDHYCLLPDIRHDMIAFNEEQFRALLTEAMSMRESGELLEYAGGIRCPVVAIHGRNDPHPWEGVKTPLEGRLNNFRMFILKKCGHEPWNEYYARNDFFAILKSEIIQTLKG